VQAKGIYSPPPLAGTFNINVDLHQKGEKVAEEGFESEVERSSAPVVVNQQNREHAHDGILLS
jgi:hypothetical protein